MNLENIKGSEPTPIRFGDNGEFTYGWLTEVFDASGERLVEAVLYFKDGDVLRGLWMAVQSDPETEIDLEAALDSTIIELPVLNPESILEAMGLPSETLRQISTKVPDAA